MLQMVSMALAMALAPCAFCVQLAIAMLSMCGARRRPSDDVEAPTGSGTLSWAHKYPPWHVSRMRMTLQSAIVCLQKFEVCCDCGVHYATIAAGGSWLDEQRVCRCHRTSGVVVSIRKDGVVERLLSCEWS